MQNELTHAQILHDLPLKVLGRDIQIYAELGSTNDVVKQQARAGSAEGLVVLAEQQTAGRGRMGRGWVAPPGVSVLMSLLLRPTWLPVSTVFTLTMLASVALCEAVEQVVGLQAALKWPNDLLLPVRTAAGPGLCKAAGILSELELTSNHAIAWVVLGIGVNVNWAPSGIVDGRDLAQSATSVSAALGQPVHRLALLRALLLRLDQRYSLLRFDMSSASDELFTAWQSRIAQIGQPIQVRLPDRELHGIAERVERSGALCVRSDDGVLHTVLAGDVNA